MESRVISSEIIERFHKHLIEEEKSNATVEKYIHDVTVFAAYSNGMILTKEVVIGYKQHLLNQGYAVRSVNSMLSSMNSLFSCFGWSDLRVKALKLQKEVFRPEEKELTKAEYERLCHAAQKKHKERLCLLLQTLCSTGIRVSELSFITVEALRSGKTVVSMKGKTRTVFLPKELQKKLLLYISGQRISTGCIFVTRTGKPLSRSGIWREMKGLCRQAHVDPRKVFPHNLRHLFARVFYGLKKDIARLADILGHSSVNTTRIYIVSSGREHQKYMEQLHLVI